jgi:hypothetical protein
VKDGAFYSATTGDAEELPLCLTFTATHMEVLLSSIDPGFAISGFVVGASLV